MHQVTSRSRRAALLLLLLAMTPLSAVPADTPARRDGDEGFGRQFVALVENEILPATRRYRDFLGDEYGRQPE
jgi:hypothetical protein